MNIKPDELLAFSKSFHDDVRAQAHTVESLREEMFVMKMGDVLEEYGEIENFIPAQYKSKGIKIDAYHFDAEFKDFTLIVSLYLDIDDPYQARVSNAEVDRVFKQASNFLNRSLKDLRNQIDIAFEAHELASLIAECRGDIRSVKIVLITDGLTQKRPAQSEIVGDIEIVRVVWDIERIYHFQLTGEREKIKVNFLDYCGGPLPCVVRETNEVPYTTILAFIPGTALADMYSQWGIRMLDMNVRVFLSARGNVNKGIRETIVKSPEMFCAYNNGITAFARSVELHQDDRGITGILSAEDFQIVNGGQTTASLYHTRKKDRVDLSQIEVQMKLTVVHDPADIPKMVPQISQYSNTQNKVLLADLAANQAPHTELQAISNSILAPDPTGGSKQTYWFYERTRNSYEELRNLTAKTSAQQRQFDEMRPKNQKFDKVKFGKVWNAYLRIPHIVSLGGQKNFGRFNSWLQELQDEDLVKLFKRTISLIKLWDCTERIIRRQGLQGYHHAIVAYTLSLLFHLTDFKIDLDKIWDTQKVSDVLSESLEYLVPIVNNHIRTTALNVGEYCKKEECWTGLKQRKIALPSAISQEFLQTGKAYEPIVNSEQVALNFCRDLSSQNWFALSKWLKERDFLTPKARSQCFNMGKALSKIGGEGPSVVLSKACQKIWNEAVARGWNIRDTIDQDVESGSEHE